MSDETEDEAILRARVEGIITRVRADVAEYGWHITSVMAAAGEQQFTYTTGLSVTYPGQPELIICGLDTQTASGLLRSARTEIEAGTRITAPGRYERIAAGLKLAAIAVSQQNKTKRMLACRNYLQDEAFDAVQLVWPDATGRFPWQPGYDHEHLPQPLLGNR